MKSLKAFFIVFLFCLPPLFPAPASGEQWPVVGRDRIDPCLLEDHSEALLLWAKKDIRNAVLINMDAHDDLRWIKPEKTNALLEIKRNKDWEDFKAADSIGKNGLYHIGSFIHAAYKLNIISKVYWVIPFTYFQEPDASEELDRFLDGYGFPLNEIDAFVMKHGRYHGTYHDIPIVICDIESLPPVREPIILTIDADFFPPLALSRGLDILTAMSVAFTRLAEKKYAVQDVTIARSVNGGFLGIERRWIVEHCRDFISHPQSIFGPYPEPWLVLGLADIYYRNNQPEALLNLARRFQQHDGLDTSLAVYQSFALLATDDEKRAFETACHVAGVDNRYAYILADLGQCFIDRGNLEQALKYFEEAYKINPLMNFRQKNLADALMTAERYEKALHYYEMYRRKNGPFPVVFVMGLAALRSGDQKQAGEWFKNGFACLKEEKYVSLENKIDIEAVREAVAYFKRTEMHEHVNFITSHPNLKKFFKCDAASQKKK